MSGFSFTDAVPVKFFGLSITRIPDALPLVKARSLEGRELPREISNMHLADGESSTELAQLPRPSSLFFVVCSWLVALSRYERG